MVINMKLPKKLLALLVAAMCAVLAAGGCNPQKTPDYGINPVALSVNGVDITLFDFDRFYTTNQKYYYLTHGAVDAQEYFETVLDEVVRYGVALSKAQELNIQLTAEDEDEVQNELQTQCDLTFENTARLLRTTARQAPHRPWIPKRLKLHSAKTRDTPLPNIADSLHAFYATKRLFQSFTRKSPPMLPRMRKKLLPIFNLMSANRVSTAFQLS